ncbi:N2,N2-dimethylguanosine tRNA methyltransferase-domain-containing protein [Geopyxis carbonaria]|nr:N2,N2-dimethylguanosine tRNA methyltransferase-domain-containing protein [Geopyxis carbonaria]
MGKRTQTAHQQPLPQKPSPTVSFDATHNGSQYFAVKEGLATLLFPKIKISTGKDGVAKEVQGDVFYNPIQQFNRDMSVLAIKTFGEMFISEKESGKQPRKQKQRHNTNKNARIVESVASTAEGATVVQNGSDPSNNSLNIKFRVLDALSATGLRALRFSLEIPFITSITANDLDSSAVQSIANNIEYNKEKGATIDPSKLAISEALSKINVTLENAQHHMYAALLNKHPARNLEQISARGNSARTIDNKYEVIDLDPYGSAAPFLDAAVQALSDGGLLCVTCTDAGVWASTGYGEKCFSLYGGLPVKSEWCHEAGLRLILYSIATSASKYGLSIEPLLSMSIDFYARLFVRIRKSPVNVKNFASSSMIVYNCGEGCGSWVVQRLGKAKSIQHKSGTGSYMKYGLAKAPTTTESCSECGFNMHLAGPMWAGSLHSGDFVSKFLSSLSAQSETIYSTLPRITGMLQTIAQEAEFPDHPFFHVPSRLSKILHCEAPPQAAVRGALIRLGYRVARSHCKPNSIKTDAPNSAVWEVMKTWIKKKPIKDGALKEGTPGFSIMQKAMDPSLDIDLDEELGKEEIKPGGVVRYQVNPTANWGPMGKARVPRTTKSGTSSEHEERPEKRVK